MAASATPRPAEPAVAVAFSGGLDSTALLHACAHSGVRVLACHVHHGLLPEAQAWAAHCEAQARELGAGFALRRLSGAPARGESVEAWARAGRHAALHEMAVEAGIDLLLLAHHRRDQAETFLLQALRGAGTAGLAAMPAMQWRDGICWARPWLAQPREALCAYAELHRLRWIDDPSNADPRFARNRLRQTLWPAFPAAEPALAQAARWAAEAQALAVEVAASDLPLLGTPQRLDLPGLFALSPARASNALRAWLARHLGQPAPASLVGRLLGEWAPGATLSWPAPGGQLHAWRGGLFWVAGAMPSPAASPVTFPAPGFYPQPGWAGGWQVDAVGTGLLSQRARAGGEQFQRAPATPPRRLKKAAQAAGLPPWRRDGPLLFVGEQLLAVAGLGVDARAAASGWVLAWVEDAAFPQPEGPAAAAE